MGFMAEMNTSLSLIGQKFNIGINGNATNGDLSTAKIRFINISGAAMEVECRFRPGSLLGGIRLLILKADQ